MYKELMRSINSELGITSDNDNLLITASKLTNDGVSFKIGSSYTPVLINNTASAQRLFVKKRLFEAVPQDYSIRLVHELKSKPDYIAIDFTPNEDLSYYIAEYLRYAYQHFYTPKLTFGCCSRYMQCSDELHCVHPDQVYAKQCHYRVNLEAGRIFYGKNKTI